MRYNTCWLNESAVAVLAPTAHLRIHVAEATVYFFCGHFADAVNGASPVLG